ncbi:MAG: hypothetical protein IJB91_07820 [Oscillospiraceae bacterium]|nr:hypothetical protein [Oscillospiraceae bacterium]
MIKLIVHFITSWVHYNILCVRLKVLYNKTIRPNFLGRIVLLYKVIKLNYLLSLIAAWAATSFREGNLFSGRGTRPLRKKLYKLNYLDSLNLAICSLCGLDIFASQNRYNSALQNFDMLPSATSGGSKPPPYARRAYRIEDISHRLSGISQIPQGIDIVANKKLPSEEGSFIVSNHSSSKAPV